MKLWKYGIVLGDI